MKHFLAISAFAALAGSACAAGAADVGVSISIGQPGFYGQIELGNMPQPRVIYAAPVIIQPVPVGVPMQPVYLRVPPGHEKHWDKHCQKYNACGQRVYFVQQNWYNNVYAPGYRREHGDRDDGRGNNGNGNGNGKGHGNKNKKNHHGDD